MPRLLAALLSVLAAALVQAAQVPEPAPGPALYFPTRVGATATYLYADGEFTLAVIAADSKDGVTVVTLAKGKAGALAPHAKVELSGRGVFQVASFAGTVGGDDGLPLDPKWVPYTTPLCLLKLPTTPGQKWDALDGLGGREACVAGRAERVRVPAGEFMAIPVEVVPEKGRGEKTWYAAGVGPVKWVTSEGKEIVLKAFTPGKQ